MRMGRPTASFFAVLLSVLTLPKGDSAHGGQSLADVARKENERRTRLEEQGIEGKIIEGNGENLAPNGNLTVFTLGSPAPKNTPVASDSRKDGPSIRALRSKLRKLDREIKQGKERIELLRTRLHAARWALPKVGKVKGSNQNLELQKRIKEQMEELDMKLEYLREERREIYEEGKKAGYLPGELEGKGIIP